MDVHGRMERNRGATGVAVARMWVCPEGGRVGLAENLVVSEAIVDQVSRSSSYRSALPWTSTYVREVAVVDVGCGLTAGLVAYAVRFGGDSTGSAAYFWLGLAMPFLWTAGLALAGAYDSRFFGVGTDEFRRVVNTGVCLTALAAMTAYATQTDIARGYVVVALPSVTILDLIARYALRKRLHRLRSQGSCMHRTLAVGHADVIAELASVLNRETHHGLFIVAACVLGPDCPISIDGIPAIGGLHNVVQIVQRVAADTVAVLACPEMSSARLRDLAWALEKSGTDLCVAPALLDVAGPRTTIRPTAGLPLLHVDHPEFSGARQLIKSLFDRTFAAVALLLLLPLLLVLAVAVRLHDGGPALFRQTRVGKDEKRFTLYKFRTMVIDAEQRRADVAALDNGAGVLFKVRHDPRVTQVGRWLRRHSLDELPQLINVLLGDMSLVGPRPALPDETSCYGHVVRRRLAVKPGITGLWQVNGRSDLPWEEAVRLDVRYVENWSFVLDLQILWKTWAAVRHGRGAY
jgi:exopolysaccharide biosynthesis polyprenyl glycosylphosphotransferase